MKRKDFPYCGIFWKSAGSQWIRCRHSLVDEAMAIEGRQIGNSFLVRMALRAAIDSHDMAKLKSADCALSIGMDCWRGGRLVAEGRKQASANIR